MVRLGEGKGVTMSMSTVRRAVLLTLGVALLVPVLARGAEPTDQDRAKAESLYKIALIAIENHDWEIARRKLQEILVIVPDQSRALLRLAEAELNLGRPSAAKKALEKAQATGLPESDRPTAEDLGPRIEYALEKQASEAPTSAFPRFGWRVEQAGVGTWKSEDKWGVPPAMVSGDVCALILEIKPPAKAGTEQEVPYDVAVFDQKHEELASSSGTLRNRKDRDGWLQEVQLGDVPQNVSELTVELRSEGKLVVRVRVPVESAGDPPPASAVQRIAGHWQGKNRKTNLGKEEGELQVGGAGPYPEFTYKYRNGDGDYTYINANLSGRLRPGKGNAWVAREMVGRICDHNDCYDLNRTVGVYKLSIEDNGKNGLRVDVPWDSKPDYYPPLILAKQ
jgi:hypothetical protein